MKHPYSIQPEHGLINNTGKPVLVDIHDAELQVFKQVNRLQEFHSWRSPEYRKRNRPTKHQNRTAKGQRRAAARYRKAHGLSLPRDIAPKSSYRQRQRSARAAVRKRERLVSGKLPPVDALVG